LRGQQNICYEKLLVKRLLMIGKFIDFGSCSSAVVVGILGMWNCLVFYDWICCCEYDVEV